MSKYSYPAASRTQNFEKAFSSDVMDVNVAILHSTEGVNWPGYSGGATAPNYTFYASIKEKTGYWREHFAANLSSRALENRAGGVQTNTLNAVQVEMIGTCDSKYAKKWGELVAGVDYIYWPDAPQWALDELAKFFKWLAGVFPRFKIIDGAPRGWVKYPDSYGLNAKQRLTFAEWNKSVGILGHQHVPENVHGDPGDVNVKALIAASTGAVVPTAPPATPKPVIKDKMDPAQYYLGAKGDHITWLGERLVLWAKALGLPAPYKVGPAPSFTATDQAAVAAFQRAQGWTGQDADGLPGPETLKRLAADPPEAHDATAIFWGGYGNLYGGYDKTDKGWWKNRALPQAQLIHKMGVSWFVALELHEDNGMAAEFTKRLPKGWKLALGRGGNQLLYDGAKYAILSTQNLWMSTGTDKRSMTKWNVKHKATGVKFWIVAAHLVAGATKAVTRAKQAKFLAANTDTLHRAFICVDRNNYSAYVGSPVAILKKSGWPGLRDKCKTTVTNADQNSHHFGDKGHWIEDMHTRDLVTVLAAEQVLTTTLADHNWFKGKFSISQKVTS